MYWFGNNDYDCWEEAAGLIPAPCRDLATGTRRSRQLAGLHRLLTSIILGLRSEA